MSFDAIPQHWTIQKLKYVASLKSGESITSEEISDNGDYPVYGGNGLRGFTQGYTHEGHYPLIGRQGALCGNINYAQGQFWASEHAIVVRIKGQNDVFWLGELLRSMNLNQYSQSAAQPGISVEVIENLSLPVPPYAEQVIIADYIKKETSDIDALVSEKEQMLALLEEKRAALISRAVTRGLNPDVVLKPSGLDWLGDVPEHWVVCQLKRLWAASDYGISDSIRDEGSIPVLRMSCIDNGKIDISKSGAINDVDEYLLLQRNDLLFNRTNSLDQIAKVGMIDFDVDSPLTFASYLVRIRASENTNPEYLVYLLNSTEFIDFARKNAIPAIGQANLSPSKYGDLRVPVPDKGEQDSIVQYLNRSLENFSVIKIELNDSIRLLKERRSALITAAVTGQLSMEEMQA